MNERIDKLIEECTDRHFSDCVGGFETFDKEKFAELIVRECAENLTKVWYEQGMDIRGAEIGKFLTRFNEHFGVEE
jgi:hypothetical protein